MSVYCNRCFADVNLPYDDGWKLSKLGINAVNWVKTVGLRRQPRHILKQSKLTDSGRSFTRCFDNKRKERANLY